MVLTSLRLVRITPLTATGHERPSAAGFLRGLAARTAFLVAAVAGLNLLADPMGVHGSRLFEPIAWRTRGEKLHLYEQARPVPEVVVLGSSRSFNVEPGYIREKTSRPAFNASLAGGGVRDYLDSAARRNSGRSRGSRGRRRRRARR